MIYNPYTCRPVLLTHMDRGKKGLSLSTREFWNIGGTNLHVIAHILTHCTDYEAAVAYLQQCVYSASNHTPQ